MHEQPADAEIRPPSMQASQGVAQRFSVTPVNVYPVTSVSVHARKRIGGLCVAALPPYYTDKYRGGSSAGAAPELLKVDRIRVLSARLIADLFTSWPAAALEAQVCVCVCECVCVRVRACVW